MYLLQTSMSAPFLFGQMPAAPSSSYPLQTFFKGKGHKLGGQ